MIKHAAFSCLMYLLYLQNFAKHRGRRGWKAMNTTDDRAKALLRARKRVGLSAFSKLQLEGFFSRAAKRVATMAMRVQYTGFARGRTESDCARLVNAAGNIVKIHSVTLRRTELYCMCTCPRKIFVNPAMQISLSDANPSFAFGKSSLSLWRSSRAGIDRVYFSVLFSRSFVFGEYVIHGLHWTSIRITREKLSIHNTIKQHTRTRAKCIAILLPLSSLDISVNQTVSKCIRCD